MSRPLSTFVALAVPLLLVLAACTDQRAAVEKPQPLTVVQVQDFVREYVAAMNAGDATKLTSMISKEQGVTSVAYGEVFRGWDAIRKEIDDQIAAAAGAKVTFATISVQVLSPDAAVASAPFALSLTNGGKSVQFAGAASIVVRRSGGELLVVHEHYSLKQE
jgi:uncharacterized protein (TIGR02246 family)